jgi:unsaturated rhamnogalacturonyl hydrolase
MIKNKIYSPVCLLLSISLSSVAQTTFYSRALANTATKVWKDSLVPGAAAVKWSYDHGVVMEGVAAVWKQTGDKRWFSYIENFIDLYVNEDGSINSYKQTEYNIDHIKNGTALLFLYRVTGKEKYWKAATLLREQLLTHPRTKEGGFWHKKIYPNQMWLDGLYMGQPFYAEYAMLAHEDTTYNDIANQFIWMEAHAGDKATGLLYHGWDESKEIAWANKETGVSPHFWGRAMGWYAMALVDVLENFPQNHTRYQALVDILNRTINAFEKVQDKKTGLWYDILDKPLEKKNYFEASASSMFVYVVAKGVRKGWVPSSKLMIAQNGYKGILKTFIKTENGQVNLHGTVKVSGLGGKPFRDGSLEYYFSEPVIVNDAKGVGAFIKAAAEMEMIPTLQQGKGKTVLLDYHFNHELIKDITGTEIQFHYIWEEMDNNGYSLLGNVFNRYGMKTKRLTEAANPENLKNASIYFIIDPDLPKETKNPNYIEKEHIETIYNWVKNGGVLMLFANDSGNVELTHYNQLANRFGINFNENHSRNMVKGSDFPTGTINIPAGNLIFKTAKNIYIKEISTLTLKAPAREVLTDKGDNIIAVSKVGKGTVFAIGDPWLYNEYFDGRKLPAYLENYKAGEDLVQWLIKQIKN